MTTDDLIKHFGNISAAMKAAGCKSRANWWYWRRDGIPPGKQALIHIEHPELLLGKKVPDKRFRKRLAA